MKNLLIYSLSFVLIATFLTACGGGTSILKSAHISRLEFGKSETADPATTNFDVNDTIFAVANVADSSAKLKIEFVVKYGDVPGRESGDQLLRQKIEFEGARPIWLTFSAPFAGVYDVEATLLDESDKKLDSKSGKVTATGEHKAEESPAKEGDKKKVAGEKDDFKKTESNSN